jgi:hypothetical protein
METSPAEIIVPVNEGAATVALRFKDASNKELLIRPPTNKLLVKETSDKTDNLLFKEASPKIVTLELLFERITFLSMVVVFAKS